MDTVEDIDLFQHCRKIIGVGMNFKVDGVVPSSCPSEPLLFLKVPTTLLKEGNKIRIPEGFDEVNYEVELGVIIGKGGSNIPEDKVLEHIGGYCVTLDMTLVAKINALRSRGHPWLLGKSWDTFTPVSDFIPKEKIPQPNDVNLWLDHKGERKQSGNTKDLVFNIEKIISYASKIMTLEKGDLFLTGTPGGAGPCETGDDIECGICGIDDIKKMKFRVA